jgi:histidine phosphotransferase ChpT
MTGRKDALHVAELLCARMVHDFSGGVGVLSNLLELAFEKPERAAEPLMLANDTAQQLVQRLKLLRAAWGPTSEPLPLDRLRDLAVGLGQTRCVVNLDGLPANTVFSEQAGRLLLNLLLLAADSLPAGGEVAVSGNANDLVVAVAGPRAAWPNGLASCIANPAEAWRVLEDPRRVQMALTVLLATQFGLRLTLLMAGMPNPAPPLRLALA